VTWTVRVRPEAELDLLIAAGWYETQRARLGMEFLEELSALVASLAENALFYAEVLEGVRRAFAHRFPYAVTYKILDDDVVVLSVLHMRRRAP
jgi:toxin ParE1/3/4